jgi:hypothetical protein
MRMMRPTKRTDADTFQIQKRLPTSIAEKALGEPFFLRFPASGADQDITVAGRCKRIIKIPLKTRDPADEAPEDRLAFAMHTQQQTFGQRPYRHLGRSDRSLLRPERRAAERSGWAGAEHGLHNSRGPLPRPRNNQLAPEEALIFEIA